MGIAINLLRDVENFLEANSLVTPLHIKPEWYFLFAYSILRCIPSKSFRVISLVLSVVFPLLLIFSKSKRVNSNLRLFFWLFFPLDSDKVYARRVTLRPLQSTTVNLLFRTVFCIKRKK